MRVSTGAPPSSHKIKIESNVTRTSHYTAGRTTHWLKPGERSSLENIQIENYGEEEPLQSNWCSEY